MEETRHKKKPKIVFKGKLQIIFVLIVINLINIYER